MYSTVPVLARCRQCGSGLKRTLQSFQSQSIYQLQHNSFLTHCSTFRTFTNPNVKRRESKKRDSLLTITTVHSFASTPPSDDKLKKRPFLNRFLRYFAVRPKIEYLLEKSGAVVDPSLQNLISTSAALGVYAFAITTGFSYFNIDTTPFVGLFGVGGAALGFGMKEIANNYVCGIVMALQSNFKRGDEVTVAGSYTGTVHKMNLRHLELEFIEGQEKKLVFIPNSDVFGKAIVVHKKMPASAQDAMVTDEEQKKDPDRAS